MSSSYNLLNIPSPTTTQHSSTGDADLSISPQATTQFKKPSLKCSCKWKTVLSHLTPSRLLHPSRIKPAKPCVNRPSRRILSGAISSSSASTNDLPSISVGSFVNSRGSLYAIASTGDVADNHLLTLPECFPLGLDVANDVEKLLHILLETPLWENIHKRMHALAALCALCVTSPNNANRCVVAGGVEMIIDVLNSTSQTRHPSTPAAEAIVEESEKALLLLQLLTSSSDDGCITALRHSSSIIAILGKKLLRISESCTASAIAVLSALYSHSDATLFRKAVSETAIPSKLVVVLQVASKESTKRRAGRLLRLLAQQEHQQTCDPSSSSD